MYSYLSLLIIPTTAYLLGSIPFGLLIVRWVSGKDLRKVGSGNIGATNVKRASGYRWAVTALVCDCLKGLLPTIAAALLTDTYHWLTAITVLAAITGHMYPVYLKFKPSGKGVATTLGGMLIVAPLAVLISILGFAAAVYLCKRVSVGSMAATLILPVAAWFTTQSVAATTVSIIIMVLILMRHRENFIRLAKGTEPKITGKDD